MDYLQVVNQIVEILAKNDGAQHVRQIKNAIRMGGTGGEILAIICSLLKVYEQKFPSMFKLIEEQAYLLFNYCNKCGLQPIPNYGLLNELDN